MSVTRRKVKDLERLKSSRATWFSWIRCNDVAFFASPHQQSGREKGGWEMSPNHSPFTGPEGPAQQKGIFTFSRSLATQHTETVVIIAQDLLPSSLSPLPPSHYSEYNQSSIATAWHQVLLIYQVISPIALDPMLVMPFHPLPLPHAVGTLLSS